MQLQTSESSEIRTERTWLTLARIGAGAFIVWAVGLQIAAGFFEPIITVLAAIYAISLGFVDSEHRGRVIAFTGFAALTMVPNLAFGSSDFTHLDSAASFIPQLFVTLAIALAVAGGVGQLRGWSGTTARTTLNRAVAVLVVGLSLSLVVSATAPSDRPLADDVTVDAQGFAWAPGVVQYDVGTSSGLWIDNRDFAHHTLAVPDLGIEVELPASKSRRVDLGDVRPGEYQIICTIPGHESMTATLEVTG